MRRLLVRSDWQGDAPGTLAYMAPEQKLCQVAQLSAKIDVFRHGNRLLTWLVEFV